MTGIGAFNIHEVALALKIDEDSVTRLVMDGAIPAAKLSDEWIFLQEDILTILRLRIRLETTERRRAAKKLPFDTTVTITRLRGRGRGPHLTKADVDALELEYAKLLLK